MNASLTFWVVLLVLIIIMWFCDRWYGMLRDAGTGDPKPYSYARVQLAWWTVLIFSAMITILFLYGRLPTLPSSMLVVLGISAGTTTTARLIDQSDQQKALLARSQDMVGVNFVLDLISDKTGVSVHRLQTFILNIAYGVWFIYTVLHNLKGPIDLIIPSISDNDLILLGLSSGTYAALKTTENKEAAGSRSTTGQQELVPDEGRLPGSQAAG